jgi:hypothetical protein
LDTFEVIKFGGELGVAGGQTVGAEKINGDVGDFLAGHSAGAVAGHFKAGVLDEFGDGFVGPFANELFADEGPDVVVAGREAVAAGAVAGLVAGCVSGAEAAPARNNPVARRRVIRLVMRSSHWRRGEEGQPGNDTKRTEKEKCEGKFRGFHVQ